MTWWQRLTGQEARPVDAARWVVLDVETTGLDPEHDVLLALAAVAVHLDAAGPRIALHDSFEVVVQHDAPSPDKDNILLHGIGVAAQRAGAPPAQALSAFEQWVGDAPLLAFHAAFDRALVTRALKAVGRPALANPWLDLAPVVAVLHPGVPGESLDDWLGHFRIPCAMRHQAASDTLATAELLLRLWPAARRQRSASFAAMQALERERRWLA